MTKKAKFLLELIIARWWVVVGIAMLASFVLILYLGKDQQVWFDESYSILLAKQNIPTLLSLTGVDAHPPIFYLLLKVWGSVFGWSELALRSMSALIASLAIGAAALLIRKLFSARIALVVLPFMLLGPFWLRFGYEIRMYAIASLLGIVGSLVLLRAIELKNDRRWWVAYGLIVLIGMYTLYVTALVWLSHFVWLLIQKRKKFWRQPWFIAYIFAAVLFLPYIPTVIFQYTHSALPGVGDRLNLSGMGNVLSILLSYTPEWKVTAWDAAAIAIVVGLTIYLSVKSFHASSVKEKSSLLFLYVLAGLAPVLFIVVSLPMGVPFFVPRYLAHLVLYIYALIGLAVALGWRSGYKKLATTLAAFSLAVMLFGISQLASYGNFNFERLEQQQAETTAQMIYCKDTLVIADGPYAYINDAYYFTGCSVRVYSVDPILNQGGFAWLHSHGGRISSPSQVDVPRIAVVWMNSDKRTFYPDTRYRLVSNQSDSQQSVATYELIEK